MERRDDTAARTAVRVGDVARVDDGDYMYGTGPLVLRVSAVGGVQSFQDEPWLELRGYEQRKHGPEGRERFALVRVAGVRVQSRAEEPRS